MAREMKKIKKLMSVTVNDVEYEFEYSAYRKGNIWIPANANGYFEVNVPTG